MRRLRELLGANERGFREYMMMLELLLENRDLRTQVEEAEHMLTEIDSERRHFSRNPKWGPSDFGFREKSDDGHGLRRPTFVLCPSRRALRRMALHFVSAGAHAPHSDETLGLTTMRGSSHSARRLRFLAFLCSSIERLPSFAIGYERGQETRSGGRVGKRAE